MDKSGGAGGGGGVGGGGGTGGNPRDGGPSSTTPPTGPSVGCGSAPAAAATTVVVVSPMTLNVTTTTGGSFSVVVDGENSVETLKKIISKKLKVSKDRICLLHRERELHDGSLRDNGLMDGSKLILTPNVETGLLAQRAENTVMQALESLNDNQVNDFLSGKSPLNLSVRLGDHMMLIQLQLSTLNPSSASGTRSKTHKSRTITASSAGPSSASTSSPGVATASGSSSGSTSRRTTIPIGFRRVTAAESALNRTLVERVGETQTLTRQDIENIHSIVKNLAESDNPTLASVAQPMETDSEEPRYSSSSESPIKSLSNLVSSSINANIPPCGATNGPDVSCTDPISANLTSCLCKRLDTNDNNSCESNCLSRVPEPIVLQQPASSSSTSSLHRTAQNPIARHKSKVQTLKKHISFDGSTVARTEPDTVHPVGSTSAPNSPQRPELATHYQQPGPSRVLNADPNSVENPALAEASRNLTQTLRKLSKRVFTNKVTDVSAQETARNVNSGAVIESMKHHGKGIYSGTFSGTLNPALQDKFGRPKRDISTIIHILNDLLSAAPQCARSGTKIYFEPSSSAAAAAAAAASAATSSSAAAIMSSGTSAGGSSSGNLQQPAATTLASSSSGVPTFTTPVAAPSPRLVSRCMPTPIQTKKFPSNGTTTSASVAAGGGGGPISCPSCSRMDPAIPSTSRCHHQQHHHPKVVSSTNNASPSISPTKVQCKCGHPLLTPTAAQCQRCAAELENSKTKSKLDNLRLIMQQKKERREARKQKCAPYPAAVSTFPLTAPAPVGASGSQRQPPISAPIPGGVGGGSTLEEASPPHTIVQTQPASSTAAAIAGNGESTTADTNTNNSSATAGSATATATATTTTSAKATSSSETAAAAAQSHQLVEEVDTVA